MAWIDTIPPERASGALQSIYDQAVTRAGKVFQILQVQSLDAATLRASMQLYMATTTSASSPLPRWFRELVATAVSTENRCVYWMRAHLADLRAEAPAAIRDTVASGDPTPALTETQRELLAYALRVTRDPASCRREHVEALRAAGASDAEIHATVQVAAYFNYINRVADALGVDPEP